MQLQLFIVFSAAAKPFSVLTFPKHTHGCVIWRISYREKSFFGCLVCVRRGGGIGHAPELFFPFCFFSILEYFVSMEPWPLLPFCSHFQIWNIKSYVESIYIHRKTKEDVYILSMQTMCIYFSIRFNANKKNYKSVDFTTSISRTLASCETLYSRRIPSICAIVPSMLYLGAQEHSRNESQIRIEEDIHKRTHTRTRVVRVFCKAINGVTREFTIYATICRT